MIQTTTNLDPEFLKLRDSLKSIQGSSLLKDTAWDETKNIALAGEKHIKDGIPVDTGRAKASWGHFTPKDLVRGKRITKAFKTKSGAISKRAKFRTRNIEGENEQVASASDAIWIEDRANLSITQGTTVPYTSYLNDGTSRMPALGFVDEGFEYMSTQSEKLGEALIKMISFILSGKQK